MKYFKFLKYETRNKEVKKKIEEALVEKMENWKYSSSELGSQVPDILLKEVSHCWENTVMVAKNIHDQTLRKVMPDLSDKEVKEALKRHGQALTPKLNAILILSNDIESVVKSNTNAWKKNYGLNVVKPTKEVVKVDDVNDDEEDMEDQSISEDLPEI